MTPETLAIIPARLNSKRAPRKNIAIVAGRPLICYTIKAALEANLVSRVIVSTESRDVAQIATGCGAESPFLRPQRLAEDCVGLDDVCLHAVQWLAEYEDYHPQYIIKLNPTSPLRIAEDIDTTIRLGIDKDAPGVINVCLVESRSSWGVVYLGNDGRVIEKHERNIVYPEPGSHPSLYAPCGGTCLVKTGVFMEERSLYPRGHYAHIVPIERSLDIDLPWHLYLADLILNDISQE